MYVISLVCWSDLATLDALGQPSVRNDLEDKNALDLRKTTARRDPHFGMVLSIPPLNLPSQSTKLSNLGTFIRGCLELDVHGSLAGPHTMTVWMMGIWRKGSRKIEISMGQLCPVILIVTLHTQNTSYHTKDSSNCQPTRGDAPHLY